MAEPISSASFELLSPVQKSDLHRFFKQSPTSTPGATEETLQSYLREQIKARNLRPDILCFQDQRLIHQTNPAMLKYMDNNEREVLKDQLILAYNGLCDRYLFNINENRNQNRLAHFAEIEKCSYLIRNITRIQAGEELEERIKSTKHHDTGLKRWRRQKAEQLQEFFARDFSVGKTVYLRQWMSDLNVWRLYWVWAGNLLRVSFGLMPNDFYKKQQAVNVVTDPQPILGHVSYILYYIRFLINFLLVLKHTIRGPWMSDEEKEMVRETGTLSRLQQQLAIRKFTLLNDILWATTNLFCFFWLIGPSLGIYGDVLTTLLLVADATLCLWAKQEATQAHEKEMQLYQDEINLLEEEKKQSEKQLAIENEEDESEKATKKNRLAILEIQLKQLKLAQEKCEQDWVYKKQKVGVDLIYGLVLILSYTAIAYPWAAVGMAASGVIMATGGSAGLFLATLIYSCYRAYIDVSQAQATEKSALEQCQEILSIDGNLSEKDYLRYQDLRAEADYQVKLANYHLYTLVRSGIVQALIPLAIFAAFTFATFGIAAAVIAAAIVIAIITHYIVEFQKPEEIELAEFNHDEYAKFNKEEQRAETTEKLDKSNKKEGLGLFAKKQDIDKPLNKEQQLTLDNP